jgi:GNAT superfamily N-acetyltransferase
MDTDQSLARQIDAAQSLLDTPAAAEARRLERALARTNAEIAEVMARLDPGCGAGVLSCDAGVAVFAGAGSPLTQGLAMGLSGPVSAADLDAIEAHLCPGDGGPGPRQVEICPFAHPSLSALLAARGYRVHEWQLVWTRPLHETTAQPLPPPAPGLLVRPMRPGEEETFLRAIMAGFLETEDVPAAAIALLRPSVLADHTENFVACLDGEVIGGASLKWADGIAFVNGSGVRPACRRRGAQGALIRARLDRARALGCALASSTTLPGTPPGATWSATASRSLTRSW